MHITCVYSTCTYVFYLACFEDIIQASISPIDRSCKTANTDKVKK